MQMNNIDFQKSTAYYSNANAPVPTAPIVRQQDVADRRSADPSSVTRVDKYPIPSFFEYRMKPREYEL